MKKCITTADYNKFTKDIFGNDVESKNLVDKSVIAGFINNADLNRKIGKLAIKAELKAEQDKIIEIKAFESSYFWGKNHFKDHCSQNYIIFQQMYK